MEGGTKAAGKGGVLGLWVVPWLNGITWHTGLVQPLPKEWSGHESWVHAPGAAHSLHHLTHETLMSAPHGSCLTNPSATCIALSTPKAPNKPRTSTKDVLHGRPPLSVVKKPSDFPHEYYLKLPSPIPHYWLQSPTECLSTYRNSLCVITAATTRRPCTPTTLGPDLSTLFAIHSSAASPRRLRVAKGKNVPAT